MDVRPLHPVFAAELIGADLLEPPNRALVDCIEEAMARHGVLVVRNADIGDRQHKAFARAFGPLEYPSRPRNFARAKGSRPVDPGLFYAGNLDRDGKIIPYEAKEAALAKGAERFHTDSSFHPMPTKWSLLRGVEVPPPSAGGDTLFCDSRAAYDDLSQAMKDRIAKLTGLHDFWKGRRNAGLKGDISPQMHNIVPFPTVAHPLVRTMPNGRRTLFIGGHCIGIKGMEPEEGRTLVEKLYKHATQDKYVYRHQWRAHDMVIWDNRCTMHAATPLTSDAYPRDMRRATINESGPETSALEWMAQQGFITG